jgi:hypothetical protein
MFERLRGVVACAWEDDRTRIVRQFKDGHGYAPNLVQPKTWCEKIQCRKLYDHDPFYTRCADKYAMRQVVDEATDSQYLVPLLGVHEDAREIDFGRLPDRFVIKANHGSGWNLLIDATNGWPRTTT